MARWKFTDKMELFSPDLGVHILKQPPIRPESEYHYLFEWKSPSQENDWRAYGYGWRTNGTMKFKHEDQDRKRYYFKLQIGVGNDYIQHSLQSMLFSSHRSLIVNYRYE